MLLWVRVTVPPPIKRLAALTKPAASCVMLFVAWSVKVEGVDKPAWRVMSPPNTEMGPAMERALPTVMLLVLPLLPNVRPVSVVA